MPEIGLPSGGATRLPRGPVNGSKGFRGTKEKSNVVVGPVAHAIGGKKRTEDVVTEDSRNKTFADMMLSETVLKGLRNAGFHQPSPVQILALPPAKLGFDLVVQSKSGTGKTAVYVVAALEMIKPDLPGLQCLVLAPTREIAVQGATVAMQIGASLPEIKISAFIGGISLAEDKIKARSCQLGVGTPGRIKQLITEGILPTHVVRLVVMDEADKLLEPAFLSDTTDILNLMPRSKQVITLSATYPDQLASIAEKFMRSPQHIRPGKASQVLHGVIQYVLPVPHCPAVHTQTAHRQKALLHILSTIPYSQVIVFSNYSTIAQSTCDYLTSRGFPAIFMSSNQDQARRNAVMQAFKQFNCRVLCSTDLTARGIDAENVNMVISMEVPWEKNTYLHRIGRGGRFGSSSVAITIAPEGEEMEKLKIISEKTGSKIRVLPETIPQNLSSETDCLEVLGPPNRVDLVKETVKNEEKNLVDTKGKDYAKKSGGKLQPRGKKESTTNLIIPSVDPLLTDSAIVRNKVHQSDVGIIGPRYLVDDISDLVSKLQTGVNIGHPGSPSVDQESDEGMERLGEAVVRLAQRDRSHHLQQIQEQMYKWRGCSRTDILQSLLVEPTVDNSEECSQDLIAEDICDESNEDTSSENSSSEESSEDSSSDELSDSEPNSSQQYRSPQLGQYPNLYGQHYPQYHAQYQYQANLAWYQQWSASLAQQRRRIELQEYWAIRNSQN